MDFKELAETLEKVEKVSSTELKSEILRELLLKCKKDEIEKVIHLILGIVGKEWEERELNVSYGTLVNVLKDMGIDVKEFEELYKKTGDPGDAVKIILERKKIKKQMTLIPIKLTVNYVYETLEKMKKISGEGAREKREIILKGLLQNMSPVEAKLLTRIIVGDMRYGVSEGILEEAISKAFKIPKELIERAHMLLGDLGEVAVKAMEEGFEGIKNVKIKLFNPIKPMLAEKADSVLEALKEHDFNTAFEFKFDGVRAQIHKKGDIVKIFSRRLKDVTDSFPEVVNLIKKEIKADEAVLEGEIIAVKNGNPLPFQVLVRRLKRERDFDRIIREIPVKLYLFDVLYLDGKMLIDEPYEKRREILEKIAGNIELTPRVVTRDPRVAEEFFKKAIELGHEGLVAKKLDSKYIPGKRGKYWLKIKSHLEPLDCVIVAAEWGHGRRRNWLSDYYLAVRDENTGKFYVIGKTFKGLSDEEMEEITKELLKDKIREVGRVVYVRPRIVVEVLYDEIQKSPKYECGYALRFARINRIRWDKSPEDADTLQRVIQIYEKQKGKMRKI